MQETSFLCEKFCTCYVGRGAHEQTKGFFRRGNNEITSYTFCISSNDDALPCIMRMQLARATCGMLHESKCAEKESAEAQ